MPQLVHHNTTTPVTRNDLRPAPTQTINPHVVPCVRSRMQVHLVTHERHSDPGSVGAPCPLGPIGAPRMHRRGGSKIAAGGTIQFGPFTRKRAERAGRRAGAEHDGRRAVEAADEDRRVARRAVRCDRPDIEGGEAET